MKKKKPALTNKELDRVVDAHNAKAEGKTPGIVRTALMAAPIEVAGYTVHPPSLAIQILLEDIDHPILKALGATSEEEAAKVVMTGRDILSLIYIFTDPDDAWRTAGMSQDNFKSAAKSFAMTVPPSVVADLVPAIRKMMTDADRAVPADKNKESGGSDPLA